MKRTLYWLCVIFLQGIPIVDVINRTVHIFSLIAWIGSIALAWTLLTPPTRETLRSLSIKNIFNKIFNKDVVPLVACACIAIVLLWYFSSIPTHYHQDEFITAYTSWTLPSIEKIDWFAAYPPIWVSKFPILFHAFQKPFFLMLGPTVNAVRISVWPYAVGSIFYLYLFSMTLFHRRIAILSTFAFILFAPHLYLSSMGLHFISSTFLYLATITHFILFLNTERKIHAATCGVFCGLSYLTYTSSYVTFPVVLAIALIYAGINKSLRALRGFLIATILTLIILLPFLTYAAFVNNFFVERIFQVNALWGSWSDPAKVGVAPLRIAQKQSIDAIRSLVTPGIGGMGGYNFGKLSLMDPLTGALFFLGMTLLCIKALRKHWQSFILLIAISMPFITGFILTTHPPPFHRLSIIYPLMALTIAIAVDFITKKHWSLLVVSIVVIAALNVRHTMAMVQKDAQIYPQNSRVIGELISATIPAGTPISIAAYPAFYLGQELVFRTSNRYPIQTDESTKIRKAYHGGPLILFKPTEETIAKLTKDYPKATIYRSINATPLGDVVLMTN